MAARVGTVLSDEHILKECAHYRPIPMKLAEKMFDGTNTLKVSPYSSKPLKYSKQLARPEHFDSYAHSMARNLGNDPEFRGKLHAAYTADVAEHIHQNENAQAEAPRNEPDAFFMNNVLPIIQGNREGHLNPHYNNFVPPAPAAPQVPQNENLNDNDNDNLEPEDDIEEVPDLTDSEDEGPPPLEEHAHVPEEENENESVPKRNEPGPSNYAGAKKMRVRETQFLPKPLPKANVSGMKLRSGTQLQGPSPKLKFPHTAYFPTTVFDARDPFDNPVRISDINEQKTRKALFNFEQQRLAHQKRHSGYGAGTSASHGAYFL